MYLRGSVLNPQVVLFSLFDTVAVFWTVRVAFLNKPKMR